MPTQGGRRVSPVAFVCIWITCVTIARVLAFGATVRLRQSIPWDILDAAVQVALLSLLAVSWRWWWGAATIAGAAVSQTLLAALSPLFWSSGAGEFPGLLVPALSVLGALPQWLVLRRYGSRSFAWLALPAVTGLTSSFIYQSVGNDVIQSAYLGYDNNSYQWVALAGAMGAISGTFEAIAMIWIIAPEFSRVIPVATPLARPPRIRATDPGMASRVGRVRTSLAIVIALAVPIFMPKVFFEMYVFPESELVLIAAAAVVPWAVALTLLCWPQCQHAGLALAGSASIIMLVGIIPLMVLWTLFAGFMQRDTQLWLSYAGAIVATVMLVIVVVQAIGTARDLPDTERVPGVWLSSVAGCIVYGFVLAAGVSRL